MLPFNNTGVVVEVSGATILEMLETAVSKWPSENGNFPHVSGITFSVDTTAEAGSRVYGVTVERANGKREPLKLDGAYTLASNNFILLECGDGMTMFEGARVISDTGILDVEILESYIVDRLGGTVGTQYAETDRRVSFTEGVIEDSNNDVRVDYATVATAAVVVLLVVVLAVLLVRERNRRVASSRMRKR